MAFTYNRKVLKNPTNFSGTHLRICVKDATPQPVQPSKMDLVLICESQVNNMIDILSNFNQGILLQDCQLKLQENAAANCNYKQKYYSKATVIPTTKLTGL